ncbi:MAG: recombinase RecA [Balneolaceae bacterium]|nr:recombinase RecA [Balneolaceae bacterium]
MSKNNNNERKKALEMAIGQIEKQHGKGTIMRLGDDAVSNVDSISTGSIMVDYALGVGGIPRGRITEIYGPEASGKTTLALHVIAEAQKTGGYAAFIDAEHAFDPRYAKNLGINTDELLVSQPDSGEQALEIMETLIRSAALDVVVIDSVAALVPRAELEGEMGDAHVGLQARLMSQALRKIAGIVNKTRTACVFINQIREKIGVMFGNPETTSGGRALKFYSSVRLDIRRIGSLKQGDEVVGNRTKVKVVKNKVAPPFKVVEFNIIYGKGISRIAELLDLAVEFDIIQKRGSWYRYDGEPIGQGQDAAMEFLESDPELSKHIEKTVREKLSPYEEEEEGAEDEKAEESEEKEAEAVEED